MGHEVKSEEEWTEEMELKVGPASRSDGREEMNIRTVVIQKSAVTVIEGNEKAVEHPRMEIWKMTLK